jgi:UDP-glucose 4-epimerase
VTDRVVVTGAAGFIGSHLCERLLGDGFSVTGIDSFTDYYDPARKRKNLSASLASDGFSLIEEDLNTCDLPRILEGAVCVFHLAAQAGVRMSWGREFNHYIDSNILATQKLLEALRDAGPTRLVYSSSSSVYGETEDLPMKEGHPTRPLSPYGATKLSAEHLCELYRANFGIDYRALRYFTVYGPRQRPDMAFSRFITAALTDARIEVYGDGRQTRDFTFITDAVEANMLAFGYEGPEMVFNIGGGSRVSILDILDIIGKQIDRPLDVQYLDRAKGDVTDTWADTTRAKTELGFRPAVAIEEGLMQEISWYRAQIDMGRGEV